MHASPFGLGDSAPVGGSSGVGQDRDTPLKDQRTRSTESLNRWQQLRLPFQGVKEPSPRDTLLIISCYRWRRLGWRRTVVKCTEHAHIPGGLQTHLGSLTIGSLTQNTQADFKQRGELRSHRAVAQQQASWNSAHASKSQMRPENPNGVKPARKHAVECAMEQKNQPKSHGL